MAALPTRPSEAGVASALAGGVSKGQRIGPGRLPSQGAVIPFLHELRLERKGEVLMPGKTTRTIPIAAVCLLAATWAAAAEPARSIRWQCQPVGGTVFTNFGVVDANTTLGLATGDLKGAVAATILEVAPGDNGTTVFSVQHHWVTESGDNIVVDVARATATMVSPGLFAVLSYPVRVVGGTGQYENATGSVDNIGEVDLNTGRSVFRYQGRVCRKVQER